MEYELIKKEKRYFAGLQHIGFMDEKGSIQEEIENLWRGFAQFCRDRWDNIEESVVDPELSYEIQIWNEEELQKEGKFYIFVGMEFKELDPLPLQLSGKVLPSTKYISFKLEGDEIRTWEEDILQGWFPRDDYWIRSFEDYVFHIQCFHEKKFRGIERLDDSELKVLVPVKEVG